MHRKKPCVGGPPPFKTYFIGRASSGRGRNFRPKTDSQPLSLSLSLFCLEIAGFFETRSYTNKSSQPLTPGRVWTLNQHLVKSLKKVWSYAEGTSTSKAIRNRNRLLSSVKQHRANKQQQKGIPKSDAMTRHAGFPTSGKRKTDQRHFNLKASTKQNLYSAESWGIYL